MARDAIVRDLFLGEGVFDFGLKIGEIIQLEENRSRALAALGFSPGEASIEKIADRLGSGALLIGEVKEVLRLGLVGAGMKKEQAFDLVERHVVAGELLECGRKAYAVAAAALVGVPEEAPKGEAKGEGEAPATPASPTAGRAGRKSTARARRSASPRKK